MGKMSFEEYTRQLAAHKEARLHGRILPKPDLRDVDLDSAPPEKQGLLQEIVKTLPEKK